MPLVFYVDYKKRFKRGAEVVGQGGEGGEFAPFGALAVVEVKKGQLDFARGAGGSDTGVETAADQGDAQIHAITRFVKVPHKPRSGAGRCQAIDSLTR